jgi:hypothetical protein
MTLLRSVDECKNLMRYFAKDENKNEAKVIMSQNGT